MPYTTACRVVSYFHHTTCEPAELLLDGREAEWLVFVCPVAVPVLALVLGSHQVPLVVGSNALGVGLVTITSGRV